jgi:hypothetical protein
MELTQEYFDSVVKNLSTKDELKTLATKDELKILASKDDLKALASKDDLKPLATKQDVTDAVDQLARIVGDGFLGERQFLEEKLDVRERVQQVESDLRKIKLALHIT